MECTDGMGDGKSEMQRDDWRDRRKSGQADGLKLLIT